MKNLLFPLLVFGGGIGLYFYSRRPIVEFENIDFINKTVRYNLSVDGYTLTGTKSYSDKNTTNKVAGKYVMTVSAEGKGFVLVITKDGKIVKGLTINLQDQTYNTIK